ncbi:MAG: TMEM43 family protein [Muribaculaceae bacterium]|nr:TMEM43 family protein [Muribaculaceae bacterium]MBR5745072.1 TMEM43 family protein [Muribaculaceae bacterium]
MKTAIIAFSTIASLCLVSCIGTGRVNDAVEEMKLKAVEVENVDKADSSLDGKVIFATADAKASKALVDETFGISANALRLVRIVEYYQYVEKSSSSTRKNDQGQTESVTTYTYEPDWSSTKVSSDFFHDDAYKGKNTVKVDIERQSVIAEDATFGAYSLTADVLKNLPAADDIAPVRAPEGAQIADGKIYYGNPASPEVGDVRVSFVAAPVGKITVLALLKDKKLCDYTAQNGMALSFAKSGKVSIGDVVSTLDIIEMSANDAVSSIGKAITKELKL